MVVREANASGHLDLNKIFKLLIKRYIHISLRKLPSKTEGYLSLFSTKTRSRMSAKSVRLAQSSAEEMATLKDVTSRLTRSPYLHAVTAPVVGKGNV